MLHSERLDHIIFWKRTLRSSAHRFHLLVKILHTCQGGYLYSVTVSFLYLALRAKYIAMVDIV